jgi:phosphate-selective porin OprO/OprP
VYSAQCFGQQATAVDLESISEQLQAQQTEMDLLRAQIGQQRARIEELSRTPTSDWVSPTSLEEFADDQGFDKKSSAAADTKKSDAKKPEAKADKPAEKKDEFPTYKITGFTQLDGGWYTQSAKNMATLGDAQDGVGFRRARLAVIGKVAEFTAYQLEVDFAAAGRPSFFDVYVEQSNLCRLGTVRVGQFVQPFSVDSASGFRTLPFLERSLPFLAFVPFRRVGISAADMTEDGMTQWCQSIYRTGGFNNAPVGDDRFATDFGDRGGYGYSGRTSHLLEYDEPTEGRYLWAMGASYSYARLGANDAVGSGTTGNAGSPKPFFQSRVLPEFGTLGLPENGNNFGTAVNGTPLVADTGRYEASNFNLFGVETVYQAGQWSLQAEWMGDLVQSAAGPVFYNGAYGEVMYRITGEHREYDKKTGVLRNPIPFEEFFSLRPGGVCGWGAWEVAARYSFVDLRNPSKLDGHYYNSITNTFNTTSKAGNGQVQDVTVGLTWFLNQHTKWQFNWIHSMIDNTAKGSSNLDSYVSRVQVDF